MKKVSFALGAFIAVLETLSQKEMQQQEYDVASSDQSIGQRFHNQLLPSTCIVHVATSTAFSPDWNCLNVNMFRRQGLNLNGSLMAII